MQNMLKLCTRGDCVVKLLNKYKLIVILILLSITSLLLIKQRSPKESLQIIKQSSTDSLSKMDALEDKNKEEHLNVSEKALLVPVYICGAVYKPGVYEVEETAILNDILLLSGGLTKEADLNQINLAQAIRSNEKIYIPKIGEEIDKMPNSYENEERAKTSTLINVNQADQIELMTLPGIGEVRAEQIVQYREQHGPFLAIEDIMNVSGVGNKIYEGLQGFITIE